MNPWDKELKKGESWGCNKYSPTSSFVRSLGLWRIIGSWLIERVPNSDHDLGSVTSTNDGGRNCHTTALKEIDSQRAQSARELAIPTLTLKSKKVAGFFHPSWCTQDMASCPLNR